MVIARALGRPDVGITDLDTAPIAPGAWPATARRRRARRRHDRRWPQPGAAVRHRRLRRVGHAARRRWRSAARDPTIGAVVLRVNSPGGSAFASDVIARAIVQLRAAGKPVVVSMGDMAASGGYYISAPADSCSPSRRRSPDRSASSRCKVDAAQLVSTAGHQRPRPPPRRARRLPVALPPLDRGGGEDGDGQDALPLRRSSSRPWRRRRSRAG